MFATYKPVHKNETVLNLLSRGIVKDDGSPGPNYFKATQSQASDKTTYQLSPPKQPYQTLPPALVGGPSTPYAFQFLGVTTGMSCATSANTEVVTDTASDMSGVTPTLIPRRKAAIDLNPGKAAMTLP